MAHNRLLLLTPDFPPNHGGVARYLELLSKHFAPRIHVITNGLLFRWMWPKWFASVGILIREKNQYDLAMTSHVLPFGTAMWIASWITKKPYLVIVHGLDVRLSRQHSFKRYLAKQVLRHARVVVANSNALAREVAQVFHLPLPLVVYPCVDTCSRSQKSVNTSADGTEKIHLLTVGRLVARKGHAQVLMALSQLKQAGKMPEFRYTIVGDGPTRQTLQELVGQLHLDEVIFRGEVTQVEKEELYASSDLFVMPVVNDPTDKEGFGLVFLEAAQFSVPSVSTKIEGIDEAIIDGETGILVEPGNVDALAQSLLQLASDREFRTQLGQQARHRVQTEFTCQNQFSKLEPYV